VEERLMNERPPQEVEDAGQDVERTVAVELFAVTKRFGEFIAVDELTLDIYGGEFFSTPFHARPWWVESGEPLCIRCCQRVRFLKRRSSCGGHWR